MNKLINSIAWTVLIYSIVMSTTHIIETSLTIGLTGVAAYTSPLLVDAVFALGKLGRLDRFPEAIRKSSLKLMLFGGAMSLTCNVVAGSNWGQRIHGVLVVVVMVWIESHAAKLAGHGRKAPVAADVVAKADVAAIVAAAEQVVREAVAADMAVQMAAAVAEAERITRDAVAAELSAQLVTVAAPARRVATAAKQRQAVTATLPAAINPNTGQPYSVRHTRRLRTGR